MSTQQIKEALHHRIEQFDERFLRLLYVMAETWIKEQEDAAVEAEIAAIPPNPDWKPLTEEDLMARLEESSAQFKRGEYVTIDELEKEMKEW
ncbi:MAG: hypothetical protein IPG32_14370 [Saprospirales bacterium]|nr:hypothetical protein [Saprospirales bacterium]